MAQPNTDSVFSRVLSQFSIDKASTSGGVAHMLAPPYVTQTQEYDIPVFPERGSSPVKTEVGPGGSLNILEMGSPIFVPGLTKRRGLKDYINHEDKEGPHPELMADQKQIVENLTEALLIQEEERVKAVLVSIETLAGHNASPVIKWDAANPTILADMRAALVAAEANARRTRATGKWKWVINEALAGIVASDPGIQEILKWIDPQLLINGQLPARILGVPVVVPDGYSVQTKMGQVAATTGIWTGEAIYLVYVDPAATNSRRAWTAMATPRWTRVSGPYASRKWRDKDEDILRDWISVEIWDGLDVLSVDGMYSIKNILT